MAPPKHRTRILLSSVMVALLATAACTVAPPDDDVGQATPDGRVPARDDGDIAWTAGTAGDLCLYAETAPDPPISGSETTLEAGDELVVTVTMPTCLSSSCDLRRSASCNISRHGRVLTVTAELGYATFDDGFCTLDCERLTATCRTRPLAAGSYVVEHAGHSVELAVPSTTPSCPIDLQPCRSDRECIDGFCAETVAGNFFCRDWAALGEPCGGYGRPESVGLCAPGLVCDHGTGPADLPGTCVLDARTASGQDPAP